MSTEKPAIEQLLAESFVSKHAREAAHTLAGSPADIVAEHLEEESTVSAVALLEELEPDLAAEAIARMANEPTQRILPAMNPARLALLLARLERPVQEEKLSLISPSLATEIREIQSYPPETAGHLMDSKFLIFPETATVREVTRKLKTIRKRRILDIPVQDENARLTGLVSLQEVVLAQPNAILRDLVKAPTPSIQSTAPNTDVVELLNKTRITTLPVVDLENRVVGVIRQDGLVQAVQEDLSADIQTMVGVSKEERALSSPFVSVRKRLPWLNINLLTAFLAAAVVGIFENIIAQVTALAVLLPVVAGQSGNTGAQALAVTMRGLALREVRARHWPRLVGKEAMAGALNGVAIALVTSLGVFVWSQSLGLCAVIGVAMVIAMTIAGVAGAAIPVILVALGQDPAQSSSIVLTTVTDVFGFFSFLGLASLFAQFL